MTWAQRPQMKGVKRPILGGKEAPGVPQPIQEILGRRPLGGGILELSAEAHTPAVAIRRKIAKGHISNPDDSQTPKWRFISRPGATGQIGSDQGFDLVIGRHDHQEFSITFVGEQPTGSGHIDPPELVDLFVKHKRACDGRHDPIGHHFRTSLAVGVVGVADEAEEAADEPGLFEDLALCRVLEGLSLFELPLGVRPVLVHRAMHQRDLQLPRLAPDDQTTGGSDNFCRRVQFHGCGSTTHSRHPTGTTRADCVHSPNSCFHSPKSARGGGTLGKMLREPEPDEMEWQFDALDLRPVERWLATLPTLSVEPYEQTTITASAQPPQRLVDSYFDTDDWRMANAGFVVRTRRHGRHDEITLKTAPWAEGAGLRQPLEACEELPASGVSDIGPDGPVGRRLHAIAGRKPIRPVLQVRTRRRSFALRIDGGDAAEIALDDTVIVVGNGQRPMQLRRVEVRVFHEWMDALGPLVLQLRAACGLQPATLSKFEAGLLARGVVIPGPPDLGSTEIDPDMNLG